jgi:hypothetical protein
MQILIPWVTHVIMTETGKINTESKPFFLQVSLPKKTAVWDLFLQTFLVLFRDRDGIQDSEDNCPNDANAAQLDNDSDKSGEIYSREREY